MGDEREIFDGRFDIEKHVGRGSAGRVCRARDRVTLRTVALKIFDGRRSPEEIAQFCRHMQKVGQIHDAGLLHHVAWGGTAQGEAYLAVDWMTEETLRARLARQPLTLRQAVKLGAEIGMTGLSLHEIGVAHLNLKPENILIPAEEYRSRYVADVAWRRPGSRPSRETRQADRGFMAPELWRGGAGDPRSDAYSLGAIVYRCLAGCMPFAEDDDGAPDAPEPDRSKPPLPLRALRPGVPELVSEFVQRLLSFDPAARPSSQEAWRAFGKMKDDLGPDADDPPPPIVLDRTGQRRSALDAWDRDPLTDRKLQAELRALVAPLCEGATARSLDYSLLWRLRDIVENTTRSEAHLARVCALCGKFRSYCEWVSLRGQPRDRAADEAEQQTLCTDCLRTDWRRVHAIVLQASRSLEGDGSSVLRAYGPTRQTLRRGLAALHEHARPHVDPKEPCCVCKRVGETMIGARVSICWACVEAANAARDGRLAAAREVEEDRVLSAYVELVRKAEARVLSLGIRRASRPDDLELPGAAPSAAGIRVYISLWHDAKEPMSDRALVERDAGYLIALLAEHAEKGIRGGQSDIPEGGVYGAGVLPGITLDFFRSQPMKPETRERLAVAAAIVFEAVKAGARYFGKNDDNGYDEVTSLFRQLGSLF